MRGSSPPTPTVSPETVALQEQARLDRIDAIRDRTSDETRSLLTRFGRNNSIASLPAAGSASTSGPLSERDNFLNFMRQGGPLAFGKFQLLKRLGKI